MADMQTLMSMVQRLQSQGIDVMALLQGAATGAMGPGSATGAGALSNNEFMGREMPPFKPFEGPGPGAVIDDEQVRQMMENSNRMPMNSMPMMRGGSTSDEEFEMMQRMLRGLPPSSMSAMPDPRNNVSGILKLLGGK